MGRQLKLYVGAAMPYMYIQLQCSATGSMEVQIYRPAPPIYYGLFNQCSLFSYLYISISTPVISSKGIDVVQHLSYVQVNCNNMFLSIHTGWLQAWTGTGSDWIGGHPGRLTLSIWASWLRAKTGPDWSSSSGCHGVKVLLCRRNSSLWFVGDSFQVNNYHYCQTIYT